MIKVRLALIARLSALALICTSLLGQTPPTQPRFEVASVKPTANHGPDDGRFAMMREIMRNNRQPGMIPMEDPGRIRLDNWALLDLIAAAYRVRANQVSGPSWLADQGFDIEAKTPERSQKEQLNGMLQSLLEERFGLKVHRDSQTKPGFALVAGKSGPKLEPAEPPPAAGLTGQAQQAERQKQLQERSDALQKRMQESRENGTPLEGFRRARWQSITTERLAGALVQFAEGPVVDETGLQGNYSVTIETWKNPDVPGGTIFEAVEKLGLKLEARKITLDTIVVDHISKLPTAN
jgi:uncharacterized protein (TIGR03435 family)